MKTIILGLVFALVCCNVVWAQEVSYPLRISDGVSYDTLHFGLDPAATNGIDTILNERELPPPPPSELFYTRFTGLGLIPEVPIGEGLNRDYREGSSILVGQRIHRIDFRRASGQSNIFINWWNIPLEICINFRDLGGGIIVDTTISDSGGLIINNPLITSLIVTIDYQIDPWPVELSSFQSSIINNDVNLFWETSKEINNMGFEVHRLKNGNSDWTNIGFVQGHFNTNENKSYQLTDKNLQAGSYNYRLKQMDVNGNFEYYNLTGAVVIGIPLDIFLSQNYPNPFNPETVINYKLSSGDHVALGIYDASGKLIRYLVNEYKPAGYYEVSLNSDGLPSGVYYYNMETSGRVISRKMLILK